MGIWSNSFYKTAPVDIQAIAEKVTGKRLTFEIIQL